MYPSHHFQSMYHLICVCLHPLLSYEIHSVWVISSSTSTFCHTRTTFKLTWGYQHPFLNNMKLYKLYCVQKVGGRQANTKHSLTMSILKGISPQCHMGITSQVALVVKNLPANAGDVRDLGLIPGLGRFPQRSAWQPTPIFMPGECHRQRSLADCGP